MKLLGQLSALFVLYSVIGCTNSDSFKADFISQQKDNSAQQAPISTTSTTTSVTTTTKFVTTTTLLPGACAPSLGTIPGGVITINDGFTATKDLQVNLKLARDGETGKMKISNNDSCGCGTWEVFSEAKVWTLPTANAKNYISIQFKDYDGVISKCAKAWIIHDTVPPVITLSLDPSNTYWSGDNTKLKLEVSDAGVGVSSVSCKLNGTGTSCAAGINNLLFQKQAGGSYLFEVSGTDNAGNIATGSISWEMKDRLTVPPDLKLTLDSTNTYWSGENTGLKAEILDQGDGVQAVVCKLNGTATSCVAGVNNLVFQKQAVGKYFFEVSASNNFGKSSSTSISWEMKQKVQNISQNIDITTNNKVDILIVDDNSPSMEYEQSNMAARMSTFLKQIQGLDWRIAFITTDTKSTVWGDGRMLAMKGLTNQYMITSAMPMTQAQKVLGDTIQRSEIGDYVEQGIFNTYRAIERSLNAASSPNKSFFRNDANLATIVISDEDESARGPKNKPENLLTLIKATWASKIFAFHSIITKPGDSKCKNTEGYTYGVTYDRLSRMTGAGTVGGAIIGSVCETDYGSQLKGIGDSVQQMQKIMNLQCAPIGSATSAVVVLLNGANYTAPYEVQGLKLVFKTNLPTGKYVLQYQCL